MRKAIFLLALIALPLSSLLSQDIGKANMPGALNPVLPGYFADPTIVKFGDIYYIYATTDNEMVGSGAPTIWYSNDFRNWYNYTMEIPSLASINLRNYWAPDIMKGDDGRYYLYFGNCQAGCNIYGYVSDTPVGPWAKLHEDDKAVIPVNYPRRGFPSLDAQMFRDDDGKIYAYWGTWVHYNEGYAAGLIDRQTMDRVTEGINIPISQTPEPFEAPFMMKKNDKYILMYSSAVCHDETYNVRYSYSDSPFGPFTEGANNPILSTNPDKSVHGPGHHSVLREGDDYYIAYHRHDFPMMRGGMSRQVCIDSLIFENDSTIRKVIPSHRGIDYFMDSDVPENIAFMAGVTASSDYHIKIPAVDYSYAPAYAVDDNNATMWKAGSNSMPQDLTIDLGSVKPIKRVMTQFEFAGYYYQYTLMYSTDGKKWSMYADRSANRTPGSPMIDDKDVTARYLKLTITATEKTGVFAAVWNIKVYSSLFEIPLNLVSKASAEGPAPLSTGKLLAGFDVSKIKTGDQLADIPNMGSAGGSFKINGEVKVGRDEAEGIRAIEFTKGSLTLEGVKVPATLAWNGSFTVATWVKNPKVGREAGCLVSWCDRRAFRLANSYNALFYNSGPFGAMAHLDGHYDMRYKKVPTENQWHHIVVTFDGVTEKVYVNGVMDNAQIMTLASAIEKAKIIVGASDTGENYAGFMASMRMYDKALTEAEIAKLMKQTKPKATGKPKK
jgi:xylan 1,4-beta-xylosidase